MIGWSERIARAPDADLQNSTTSKPPSGQHGGGVLLGLSGRNPRIQLSAIPRTKPRNPIQFLEILRNLKVPVGWLLLAIWEVVGYLLLIVTVTGLLRRPTPPAEIAEGCLYHPLPTMTPLPLPRLRLPPILRPNDCPTPPPTLTAMLLRAKVSPGTLPLRRHLFRPMGSGREALHRVQICTLLPIFPTHP